MPSNTPKSGENRAISVTTNEQLIKGTKNKNPQVGNADSLYIKYPLLDNFVNEAADSRLIKRAETEAMSVDFHNIKFAKLP